VGSLCRLRSCPLRILAASGLAFWAAARVQPVAWASPIAAVQKRGIVYAEQSGRGATPTGPAERRLDTSRCLGRRGCARDDTTAGDYVAAIATIVMRVRLLDGEHTDLTFEDPAHADEAELIDQVIEVFAGGSGVLRCRHGDRLVKSSEITLVHNMLPSISDEDEPI